jgi:predicted nucleotidyltransferase
MLTQKSAIAKVRRFAREIKASGVQLQRIVLYGSYARNEQHKWSDIDVALVSDSFRGIGFYDIDLFARIHIQKPFCSIQPRTYNTKDFSPGKDPFVEEILKTGIEIEA